MSNTPEINSLQKVVVDLQTAIQSGDCTQMNAKIKDVLKEAQPVQNLIQVGKVQESDETISNLKAEIRVATGEILQKCPRNTKTNNIPKNNTKTNNTPKNNTNTNTNTVKTNNTPKNNTNVVMTNNTPKTNTNTNTVKTNNTPKNNITTNTMTTNSNTNLQTGGKRAKRKTRKSMRKSRNSRNM